VKDQSCTLFNNVVATLGFKCPQTGQYPEFKEHKRGKCRRGPWIVAMGHDHEQGIGIGPDNTGIG
jgi:hypothetical protein